MNECEPLPGGEFAFVTFGLASSAGLLSMAIVNQINLAVVLTMAATPLLATLGGKLKGLLKSDQSVASLAPNETEAGAYTHPLLSSTSAVFSY